MSETVSLGQDAETGVDAYELEERLHVAESRYARARACVARIRAEYESLVKSAAAVPGVLSAAQERLAAATARCDRARRKITEMELLLD